MSFLVLAIAEQSLPAPSLPKGNRACLVCHSRFQEESLAVRHLAGGIPCAGCHGASYEHMQGGGAGVRPDVVYAPTEVNGFCERCHRPHQLGEVGTARLARRLGSLPVVRQASADTLCTTCHGKHAEPRAGPERQLSPGPPTPGAALQDRRLPRRSQPR